jgi:hypothetical protein
MSAAVRYPELAEGLSAVRAIVETLDRSVRGASGALPAEVVARWGDFHARWRAVTGAFDTVDRGPAERAQAHAWLSELASHAARWTDALGRWGVPVESVQVGFDGFISPSRARARMDSVNAEVATLNEHIAMRRAQLGEPFVHAWSRWRDTWRSFYGGYPPAWDWWYLGNASAWNETLVYQERLGDWRQAAERAGVRFTVPAPQSAPERRDGGDWLGSARDIAIAGAVGAAVLGAVYLVSRVA